MAIPDLGYLALSENPSAEAGRALIRQFVLVREADRMGYDDIWLGEQHADSAWPQGAIVALLGHLAAASTKARIGALPLLPALRQAQPLAEDLATLDLLSKGRLELAVASGGAQPGVLAAHGLTPATARERLIHVMAELQQILGTPQAAQPGSAGLVPAPGRPQLPTWLAADDEASLRHAGAQGWGVVAAATHTQARVLRARRIASEAAASAGLPMPPLLLARFACSADTHDEAVAIARPYLEAFALRARAAGWGADPTRSLATDPQALLAESLVGSHAEVAQRFSALATSHGASRVAIVPTSGQFDTHKHILAAFVDEVRPLLDD